jgi:hypothetical protein
MAWERWSVAMFEAALVGFIMGCAEGKSSAA